MRGLFACLPAALVVSAFGALPAAANFTEDVWRMGDPHRASQAPARTAPRKRVARATTLDDERDYDVRPSFSDDEDDQPRATEPRRSKAARPASSRKAATRSTMRRTARKGSQRMRNAARAPGRLRVASLPGGHLRGVASYYYSGHTTASGSRYNPDGLSAAHRTLPFGTRVRIRHLGNGRSVDVRINDRGPFIGGRVIDLSRGAARVIGMIGSGLARVSVEILGR
jgi:rare lipoprotein A